MVLEYTTLGRGWTLRAPNTRYQFTNFSRNGAGLRSTRLNLMYFAISTGLQIDSSFGETFSYGAG